MRCEPEDRTGIGSRAVRRDSPFPEKGGYVRPTLRLTQLEISLMEGMKCLAGVHSAITPVLQPLVTRSSHETAYGLWRIR